MGDEQRGDPQLALDGADGAPQLEAHAGVERSERLVEQQHLRLVREGAGERDALLLAAGKLARGASAEAGQTDHFQQLVAAAAAFGGLDAADAQRELDVLGRRHAAEQRIALEHESDAAPGGRQVGDVAPVEQHPSGVHVGEAGDHAQQGALAAARGAQQDVELPLASLQRDAVHHRMPGVALGEVLEDDRHRWRWRQVTARMATIDTAGDICSRRPVPKPGASWNRAHQAHRAHRAHRANRGAPRLARAAPRSPRSRCKMRACLPVPLVSPLGRASRGCRGCPGRRFRRRR